MTVFLEVLFLIFLKCRFIAKYQWDHFCCW